MAEPTLTRAQIEAIYEAWMRGDEFEGPSRGFMVRVDAMLGTGQRPLRAVLRDILDRTEGMYGSLRDEAEALLARADDDESLRVATLESALRARTAERDLKDAAIVDVYRQVGTVLSVLELKSEPSTDERAEIAMLQRWRQRLLAAWPTEPRQVWSPGMSDEGSVDRPDTSREAVEQLIAKHGPVGARGDVASPTCAKGEHGWCSNRSPAESHCGCACHLQKFIEGLHGRTQATLQALLAERSTLQGEVATLKAASVAESLSEEDFDWIEAICSQYALDSTPARRLQAKFRAIRCSAVSPSAPHGALERTDE